MPSSVCWTGAPAETGKALEPEIIIPDARARLTKTTTLSNEDRRKLNRPIPREGAGIALINLGILPLPNTAIMIRANHACQGVLMPAV